MPDSRALKNLDDVPEHKLIHMREQLMDAVKEDRSKLDSLMGHIARLNAYIRASQNAS